MQKYYDKTPTQGSTNPVRSDGLNQQLTQIGSNLGDFSSGAADSNSKSFDDGDSKEMTSTGNLQIVDGEVQTYSNANYIVYSCQVSKGDLLHITATHSVAKAFRYGFTRTQPVAGVKVDGYQSYNVTSVDIHATAPYDGYLAIFHYGTYFTDMSVKVMFNRVSESRTYRGPWTSNGTTAAVYNDGNPIYKADTGYTNCTVYTPVKKGDVVHFTATNSTSRSGYVGFSSIYPAVDGTPCVGFEKYTTTAIDHTVVAPIDGYFTFSWFGSFYSYWADRAAYITKESLLDTVFDLGNADKELEAKIDEINAARWYWAVESPTRIARRLINSDTGVVTEASQDTYSIFYLAASEGDKLHISTAEAHTLKYGYCANIPEIGDTVTLANVESAIAEYDYTMPSDGYFVMYYSYNYMYALTLTKYTDKLAEGGSSYTDTYQVEMFGGILTSGSIFNGPIRINSSSDNSGQFFRYLHSGLIEFNGSDSEIEILSEIGSTETLSIATYGKTKEFLGNVTDVTRINDGVCYIRLYLTNTAAYTARKVLSVRLTQPTLGIKYAKVGDADSRGCFAFETTYPVVDEIDTDVLTPVVSDERQYDNGHILLPPNYSADGEPVPLIIFCHGTGGLDFNGTYGSYYDYKSYLRDEGYAVADCSGLTNKNWSVTNVFNAPSAMACYEDMYRYIVRNFNIRTDGVYIMGKSAGGFMSILMAHKQPFKIKASAPLCPAISWMASSLTVEAADSIQIAMEQIGFGSRTWTERIGRSDHFAKWLANYNWEIGGQQGDKPYASTMSSDMQFIMDNLKKLVSYDPLFINSDLDFEAFMDICFDKMALRNSMNSYYVSATVDGTTYTQEMWQHDQQFREQLVAMCASAHKYLTVPMKIWEAEDDNETPWGITKMLQSMVQNSGGTLYIRKMPNGHGSHHSVDSGGPMASGTTKFGKAYTDIPVAYVEVADWFDRW